MQRSISLLALLSLVAIGCQAKPAESVDRPNVILMMADDLANEDLSCYGSARIKTPRIDGLASEGLRLTSYYAGNPVCSPSRMALLSGSYPARLGWRWGVQGYGFAPKTGMSPKVYTVAEAFRDGGYRTAMTGKWHLGDKNMRPEDQGFESAYYIRMSNNQNRDMYRDGELVQEKWDNALLSETFTEEVVRVINEESDKPFFLYVPWTAPHFPADPHPDWAGKSGTNKSAKYTDTVEELDHRIGQVLDALEKAGKADNTIVIFTSDNGRQGGQQGPNDDPPFSGMKWHSKEGGTRVPCIVRYPGKVSANQASKAMACAIDLYPTLAHASRVAINLPKDAQKMDGVNIWGTFVNNFSKHPRTERLYWHGKGQATAIRGGDWKLFFNAGDKGDPDLSAGPLLFNLAEDPKETTNLAEKHPEKTKALLARAKELLKSVYGNQVPIGTWPGVEPTEPPLKAEDVWGTWIK
ncbi:MAG: sulfatase-like hydrolase/transferase [Phycisphaeraceae bacterium]|nr:sulfatase-like hydrolase/transferase [Phycisphaeraceae bacterium]